MDLIEAYRNTHYKTEVGITLLIDTKSPKLDELLRNSGLESAVFITAWNPFSEMYTDEGNSDLNKSLRDNLLGLTLDQHILNGFGADPSGKWPGEQSFLALGITKEAGTQLALKYRQNAFVYHKIGFTTELVLTFPV
jgi:hypothetical protein